MPGSSAKASESVNIDLQDFKETESGVSVCPFCNIYLLSQMNGHCYLF